MIDINKIYQSVQDRARKNQAGFITPDQFNRACEKAVDDIYNRFRGTTKNYVHQKSSSIVEYAATQHVEDLISYFFGDVVLTPTLEGYLRYPLDYEGYRHLEPLGACKGAKVKMKRVDEKDNIVDSTIHPPTERRIYAFCEKRSVGIQVIPANAAKKYRLKYFKMTETPIWAYTVTDKGKPIYDATNSVQISLPKSLREDVINIICTEVGIPLSDMEMVQYSEASLKNKGA